MVSRITQHHTQESTHQRLGIHLDPHIIFIHSPRKDKGHHLKLSYIVSICIDEDHCLLK